MANKYDPYQMKQGAERIEQELQNFKEAKDKITTAMSSLKSTAFNDSTGQRFVTLYKQEAKPAMEDLEDALTEFVALLKMCAKKFGNAIDNGNSFLSS